MIWQELLLKLVENSAIVAALIIAVRYQTKSVENKDKALLEIQKDHTDKIGVLYSSLHTQQRNDVLEIRDALKSLTQIIDIIIDSQDGLSQEVRDSYENIRKHVTDTINDLERRLNV